MKLALAQISPRLGDVAANLAVVEATLAAARTAGDDLVVFPELALTGYRLRDLVPQVAVRLDQAGPVTDRLGALSRELSFVLGLVEESADHRFFNAATLWHGGQLAFVHRKCYLPTYGMFDEAMDFAKGSALSATDTPWGRIGLLICEDAWHPATTTVLTQDGATLVIVIAASPLRGSGATGGASSMDAWRQLAATLAKFHTVPVVVVNRAGYEDGLAFAGASFACGADGALLAEGPALVAASVEVTLDPEATRAARTAFPLLRDERAGLLARAFARLIRERHGGRRP